MRLRHLGLRFGTAAAVATLLALAATLSPAAAATMAAPARAAAAHSAAAMAPRAPHGGRLVTHGAGHRLTPAEIVAAGLTKHGINPRKAQCWSVGYNEINWPTIYLGTSETWCGANNVITYAQAGNCYGGTRYPTYNYLGCSQSEFNPSQNGPWQAQLETTYRVCLAWVPWPFSSCLDDESVTQWGSFDASGIWGVSG
ncbi:MAG TPA: hypothetical protein VGS19_00910 [Streptosporangiaceae bacterium]|nr:hypothetical protein [Streptosporangiaceae bacterium]